MEDKNFRFVCKFCYKKFPCGKSLGGHIRSHATANSPESVKKEPQKAPIPSDGSEDFPKGFDAMGEFMNGQSSYGLRENPRRTWRAAGSTFLFPQERLCKQCGKGFQSIKALCGHMASHSEKDRAMKDDQSWTSESQKVVMDGHSDTEFEDRVLRTRSSKTKRCDSPSYFACNGCSSASEVDEHEQDQEEVAMCLMLLSMDSGTRGGVTSVAESSENDSVVPWTRSSSTEHIQNLNRTSQCKKTGNGKAKDSTLDAEIPKTENSDSGYFLEERAKVESDVSVDWLYRNGAFGEFSFDENSEEQGGSHRKEMMKKNRYDAASTDSNSARKETQKRVKYECLNCKRTFNSYQGLGGHRPCNKRNNAHERRSQSDEDNLHNSTDSRTNGELCESSKKSSDQRGKKKVKPKKSKGHHACPFCQRVFKNGQALGGHKRSHFIGGHVENVNLSGAVKANRHDLLDLNLPAPEANEGEENDGVFRREI